MSAIVRYDIVDLKTGAIVGTAKTLAGARRSVDRRDNEYGGYRYRAKPVYAADGTAFYFNSVADIRATYERNGASPAIVDRLKTLVRIATREGETALAGIIAKHADAIASEIAA